MQCKWYGCKNGTGNSGFYNLGLPSKCIHWSSVGVILDDVSLTVDFFGRGFVWPSVLKWGKLWIS